MARRRRSKSVNLPRKQRRQTDAKMGRPRKFPVVPHIASFKLALVTMAAFMHASDYTAVMLWHIESMRSRHEDRDVVRALGDCLDVLESRNSYNRSGDGTGFQKKLVANMNVVAITMRLRSKFYICPLQAAKSVSALNCRLPARWWLREVFEGLLRSYRWTMKFLRIMNSVAPSPPCEESEDACVRVSDQKKFKCLRQAESVDRDGNRVTKQEQTNIQSFDVLVPRYMYPLDCRRLDEQGIFRVHPRECLHLFTWDHMLDKTAGLWERWFDRLHRHVMDLGGGQDFATVSEAAYLMLSRPSRDEYPPSPGPVGPPGDYVRMNAVIPNCDTCSKKDATRIVNRMLRDHPNKKFWVSVSDEGYNKNLLAVKRERPRELGRVIPYSGDFHGVGNDNNGCQSLTYCSCSHWNARVLNRHAIQGRPLKLDAGTLTHLPSNFLGAQPSCNAPPPPLKVSTRITRASLKLRRWPSLPCCIISLGTGA